MVYKRYNDGQWPLYKGSVHSFPIFLQPWAYIAVTSVGKYDNEPDHSKPRGSTNLFLVCHNVGYSYLSAIQSH
jgi:hypothetical protein